MTRIEILVVDLNSVRVGRVRRVGERIHAAPRGVLVPLVKQLSSQLEAGGVARAREGRLGSLLRWRSGVDGAAEVWADRRENVELAVRFLDHPDAADHV